MKQAGSSSRRRFGGEGGAPSALDASKIGRRLCVAPGTKVRLLDAAADQTFGWEEEAAKHTLATTRDELEELQYKMYADGRFGLLVVLQAIDGGGKDGTIRHVFKAFNPQGCTVAAFKAPSPEELQHDYLWRIHAHAPRRGEIVVFNRSHYEDVLVPRVDALVPKAVWERRYGHLNDFERMLDDNHIRVVKFFLHVSRGEQRKRFADRLRDPASQWKFDPADLEKRKQWNDYRKAFEAMLGRCSTPWAPWHVIPADRKWFRNLAVSQILLDAIHKLPLRFPPAKVDPRKVRIR